MVFTQQINPRLLKGSLDENSNQEVYEGSTDEGTKNYSRTKRSKVTSWLHGNWDLNMNSFDATTADKDSASMNHDRTPLPSRCLGSPAKESIFTDKIRILNSQTLTMEIIFQ